MNSQENKKVSYASIYKVDIDDSKKNDFVDEIKRIGIDELKHKYPSLKDVNDSEFTHSIGYCEDDFVNSKISIRIEVKV